MYELIQVSEQAYYVDCPAKIGIVKLSESEVCLIDSGSDKEAAKKVYRILCANNWQLRAIYTTHSNADHIGGNQYLQQQTGCDIYARGIERDFSVHPVLEPAFLYGGYPCKDLRHKFLMAKESTVKPLSEKDLPEGLEMISLPGHFFDMVGFRTADGVVFLADCLSSAETLKKYAIGFLYDVGAYLDTLERVKEMQACLFVPAHAAPTTDIAPLAQYNIDQVNKIAARILEICATPTMFEDVLQQLFAAYGLRMSFEQYVLVGSTVRSYLSYLKDQGKLDVLFEDGRLLWKGV